jgi:hypothetical protein
MPKLDFHQIGTSNNISGVHYDEDSQVLTVQFKNGGVYSYKDVTPDHFDGIKSAESAGRYFHQHLRHGGYAFSKLAKEDYDPSEES